MDHGHCLRQLMRLGASVGSLRMVAAFLTGRMMTISINGINGGEKSIVRGSPQGSVLGCLLYCVTTQALTDGLGEPNGAGAVIATPEPVDVEFGDEASGFPMRQDQAATFRFFPDAESDSEDDINFWDTSSQSTGAFNASGPSDVGGEDKAEFKYIDDTTLFEAVDMATAIRHITAARTSEVLPAPFLENGLAEIARRALEIGMKVNVKKTQLLCISPSNGCLTSAAIQPTDDGEPITSNETMKLVGFTFGDVPGVGAHVDAIREEYRRKIWMLFHLREAGIRGWNLFRLYCCYIRSRIEYLSVAYHSMLLKGQAEALEKLHRYAVGVCFGFEVSTRITMADMNIEPLSERRLRRVDAFASKVASNPRFSHWFPIREEGPMLLRNRRVVLETRSRTERRHNGPICYLRRRISWDLYRYLPGIERVLGTKEDLQ